MAVRRTVLRADFFERDTLLVARELLGKWLVRRTPEGELAALITEVEAYDGPYDRASHASRGRTDRNAPMFGVAGRWYVYLCYGMHWMLNVVTGPKDYPAAVLIRSVECIGGCCSREACRGPGRLTKQLSIDGQLNGRLAGRSCGLWVEDRGLVVNTRWVRRTPRIGVDYAGEWAARPYRFLLELPRGVVGKLGLGKL